jgi:hypothetical protein
MPLPETDPSKRRTFADTRRDICPHTSGTRTGADGPGVGRKPFGQYSPLIIRNPCLLAPATTFGSDFVRKILKSKNPQTTPKPLMLNRIAILQK